MNATYILSAENAIGLKGGRQLEYSFNVGIELAQELLFTSRQTFKLMEHEYQELFEKFRDKLADLKSQQNF